MNPLIKYLPVLFIASSSIIFAQDSELKSELTDTQKEEFLDILKTLQDTHTNEKMKRIKQGIAALTPAVSNDNEAMALFEKCYKIINYDRNENTSSSDWREWRNKNKDELGKAANKRALKYQAKWALITLKAAMEPEETFDPSQYAGQAMSLIGEIINDDKSVLTNSNGTYSSSMMQNAVGQFFELGSCRPQNWPDSIMDIERVFESLVIRPSQSKSDIASVRKGFKDLIAVQKRVADLMKKAESSNNSSAQNSGRGPGARANNMRRGGRAAMDPNNFELYARNQLWRCEFTCYEMGDEAGAAQNMLNLIKSTADARQQEQFINQLQSLLDGSAAEAAERRRFAMENFRAQTPQRPQGATTPNPAPNPQQRPAAAGTGRAPL